MSEKRRAAYKYTDAFRKVQFVYAWKSKILLDFSRKHRREYYAPH